MLVARRQRDPRPRHVCERPRASSTKVTLENYRYIFTGEVPPAYLQVRRQPRDDLRCGAAGAAQPLEQRADRLAALVINLLLGAPAAFVYARYVFPGKRLTFMFLHPQPAGSGRRADHADLHDAAGAGLVGIEARRSSSSIRPRRLPFTRADPSVFFRKMPHEIFEAAMIDGCSRLQAFSRIAVPLALPSIAATGLFAFMLSYSEFMFAMVLSGEAASRPASVVMAALARNPDVSWSLLNTAIFIAILPTIVLVTLVWRYVLADLVQRCGERMREFGLRIRK